MDKERSSKSSFATYVARRCRLGCFDAALLMVAAVFSATLVAYSVLAQVSSPHLDPVHGVNRIVSPAAPIGSCGQCHVMQQSDDGDTPAEKVLFSENTNNFCFTADGQGPCHKMMPVGYPATESSRIPDGFPDGGYFERPFGLNEENPVDCQCRTHGRTTSPSVVSAILKIIAA